MLKLSVMVLTKNEEKNIKRCLASVSFADEIIIIDDFSSDKTLDLVKVFSPRVFQRHLNNDFAAQRNFALTKARGDWILFIDADEVVSQNLKRNLIKLLGLKDDPAVGYFIGRKDIFLGKTINYGESGSLKILRLGKKTSGTWVRKVHEYWQINGLVLDIEGDLFHYPHPSLREFIREVSSYSSIHALENEIEGKKASLAKIIVYPPVKFFYNWLIKLGFLDGVHGFIYAFLMSFHSFLSWSKLWLKQNA